MIEIIIFLLQKSYISQPFLKQSNQQMYVGALTPAKKIIPHQVLLLGKHGHHNECVQVNAFTEHPEVVAAHQVKVDELRHFTTNLWEKENDLSVFIHEFTCKATV